ncbi:hypothetical protein ACNI3K_01135 [Demequina sp. SO4-13]|uniref:hypothetical protein n=1 Tax=Demequina sp. SO4-13 TaxID=3401027 RepID=UPI003AF587A7
MNLHEELGRHGADAVDESAQRLSSSDVRSALGERVRRGRRRRAVGGGVGAVAGIALVGVGVWGVLPGATMNSEPAAPVASIDPELEARGEVYRIDGSAPADPEIPIDVQDLSEEICAMTLDVNEGVTVHDPDVVDRGVAVAALSLQATPEDVTEEWLRELPSGDPGDAWDNLVAENPVAVDATAEQHLFDHQVAWQVGDDITTTSVALLLQDDEVVGVSGSKGFSGDGAGSASSHMWTPSPGVCGDGSDGEVYTDGVYEPVLVSQVWSDEGGAPLATVVISAGEVDYTGLREPDLDDSDSLGSAWGDDALASVIEVREWTGGLECAALLGDQDFVTGTGDSGGFVGSIPVPSTIETGRLYGYGDDALVGGYPIPVGGADGEADPVERMTDVGDTRLLLRGVDGTWVFDARWSERDDLPHDEPGWFVELNQVWDCGNPDLIAEGEYSASLVVPEMGDVYDLTPITVVNGVPSIPEIDEQG